MMKATPPGRRKVKLQPHPARKVIYVTFNMAKAPSETESAPMR
jgi:hypothetical protein